MLIRFVKMHGLGNDFVVVDGVAQPIIETADGGARDARARNTADRVALDALTSAARAICDRRFGIGGDGLIVVLPSAIADFRMHYVNSDGSISAMCGNGIRCVGK